MHLGFITGVGPLISYYYGARDYDKVNLFIKYSRVFILASSIIVAALALLEAPIIARVFVEPNTAVYHMATSGIRFLSVAFLFTGINVFAAGFFTSYANGKIAALICLNRGFIMIIIGAVTFPLIFGLDGVWLTVIFSEVTTVILSFAMFKKYKTVYNY